MAENSFRTFIGELNRKRGGITKVEIIVDMDAAKSGQFKAAFTGNPNALADVKTNDYLAWIKTVLVQVSKESGKSISYAGVNQGKLIRFRALPDGRIEGQ